MDPSKTFLEIQQFQEFALHYGKQIVFALAILVFGLISAQYFRKYFKIFLRRFMKNEPLIATITNVFYTIILIFVIAYVLQLVGMHTLVIRRLLIVITLGVITLVVVFRPYIPTLPFKVGQVIKTGDLLGRVEATTFIHTRISTFDGRTVFVPNTKILNDYVINYRYTPNRRVVLEVGIRYDQDLLKAKQILESIFVEDPRVLPTPRPAVYVKALEPGWVLLWARGWTENVKYWMVKCELLEKTKFRFDHEGIIIAFPQRDVHLYHETPFPAFNEKIEVA